MSAIILTPDVIRALAQGLDRLNDGDLDDRAAADRVDLLLAQAGYLRSGTSLWAAGPAEVQEWQERQVREAAEAVAWETAWNEKWSACVADHPGEDEDKLYARFAHLLSEEIHREMRA